MEKITSFTVDHLTLDKGLYLSRQDGDCYTYDLRMRAPYRDPLLTNVEMHSLEHILATALRNGTQKERVLYVGPMGCQTGFYVLFRDLEPEAARAAMVDAMHLAAEFNSEMPGNSRKECGNCLTLDLDAAKAVAREYLSVLTRAE